MNGREVSRLVDRILPLLGKTVSSPQRKLVSACVATLALYLIRKRFQSDNDKITKLLLEQNPKAKKGGKGNVDAEFFRKIKVLLAIVIPSWTCKEVVNLMSLGVLLILRTLMSIWLAEVNGNIVRAIVNRSLNDFIRKILGLMLFAIPSSAVNAGMDYFTKELGLQFRTRLTDYFVTHYTQKMYYYKVCNLDSRIQNPDQRITQDVDKWAHSLATLFLNFSKPILDLILFSKKLSELVGWEGPLLTIGWYLLSGIIIRIISPSFGKLIAVEQKLEGEYRQKHSDLLSHSEEVAFYNGSNWEKTQINKKFEQLRSHLANVMYKRFLMGIFDSMLVKYGAFIVGYGVLGLPVFGPGKAKYLKQVGNDSAKITKDFVRNSSLLINLAKAIGRVVVSYKEVQSLAGYTTLVFELKEVLDDLEMGHYKRVMVKSNSLESQPDLSSPLNVRHGKEVVKQSSQLIDNSLANQGEVVKSDNIIFINVPILSPNGDTLIRQMNFEIRPGMNLMITGPNGCGKSSLFRIMGGLWPLFGGKLYKPDIEKIFYIPQRPYLPIGTLRDQIIYPHRVADLTRKNMTDADLQAILDIAKLGYIVRREGGWDAYNDWNDVLSGGEKQRIAMARLIYHKPTYAILDECTSAVSIDVESFLYQYMKNIGITLITVSHRETVWKFHDYLLKFLGDRQYVFCEMPEDKKI